MSLKVFPIYLSGHKLLAHMEQQILYSMYEPYNNRTSAVYAHQDNESWRVDT